MEFLTVILIAVVIIWLSALTYYNYVITSRYNRLIRSSSDGNFTDIFDKLLESVDNGKKSAQELSLRLSDVQDKSRGYIQKVSVLRFNPFSDTGGDQSFILTLLDSTESGVILTSLHSRGMTRWYAKNVHEGKGVDFELSAEEQRAMKQAFGQKSRRTGISVKNNKPL